METNFASNAIPACFSREIEVTCFIHTKSILLCSLPILIVLDECRRSSADFRVITRAVSLYISLVLHCTTVLNIRNFWKCNVVYIELPAEERIWNSCGRCMMLKSKSMEMK